VVKPEGKEQLERPISRWDNIKLDLREIRCMVGTGFIWLMMECSYEHGNEPSVSI
jgi:hypothetical protein